METTGRVLGVSTVDSTPLEANQLTDPESVSGVQFVFIIRQTREVC